MKLTIWNDGVSEKEWGALVTDVYPGGIHTHLASVLQDDEVETRTATLDDPECGLTEEILADTDVLIWWAHIGHDLVPDEIVERVYKYVMMGTGLIVLHSGHHSKIFRRLMGTTANLRWRDDVRERIWTIKPNHPIAANVPETFVLEQEEMYGEPFDIPEPMETIFMGWFAGGEVCRSGCTWVRGNGKIFYFQPGHESNPSYHNEHVKQILRNAVRWACPIRKNIELTCPWVPPVENL